MKRLFLCWVACVLLAFPASVVGQDADGNSGPETLRERRIYVPYERLEEALHENEKGIFVPYSDFIKLWEEATRTPETKPPPEPPIDAAIVHAGYRGEIAGDMATFRAELRISALKEKWGRLPLTFRNIAVTSASLDGETPLLKPTPRGLELILPERRSYLLTLDFSTRVQTIPGKKFIDFQLPSAPLTRIDMTIPGEDLDVEIKPMLSKNIEVREGATEFTAFLSPQGKVNVSWLAKTIETKTAKSMVFASLFSEFFIRESVYELKSRVDFSVMRAKTDVFRMKLPEGMSLVRVDGKNIKDWDADGEGMLSVTLYEEISGPYSLLIHTERQRPPDEKTVDFPRLEAVDAKRVDGVIVIKSDPSLRVRVGAVERAARIDPSEIRSKTSLENLAASFRHPSESFLVRLNVERITPRVTARQDILITITDAIIDYDSRVHFNVRDAGVFEFEFLMPEGFRVVDVGEGDAVDDFSLTREMGGEKLRVLLTKKARGEFVLPVRLEADKEDGNITIPLPKLICVGVEKEEGEIAISLKKNLKLTTEGVKSLRPIALEQPRASRAQKQGGVAALAAGWAYSTTDYACTLSIEKRKTRIIANVERNIRLEEAVLKIDDVIRYDILYAPVSVFRLELPAPSGGDAVVTGDDIKEKRFVPDEKEGTGHWVVTPHAPRMNRYTLSIHQEIKLPEAEIGKKRSIAIPSPRVLDVFNESGAISVSKDPGLQVEAVHDNLEPIDTKELPASMAGSRGVLAFKYLTHPYSLTLESTRHEYEKVLDAIVNEAHFDIVVSREGAVRTEGVFLIQNTNRQSLEIRMPEGFESVYSVFISGRKAGIGRGGSERSKIVMLPKEIQPGREFTLRMIYQSGMGKGLSALGRLHVESAEIVDAPTSRVTWRLYLPEPYSYLRMEGSMAPDHVSRPGFGAPNASLPSHRVDARRRIAMNEKAIMRQGDEKAVQGFDAQIIREGRLYSLSKLDGGAFTDILYVKKSVLFNISILLVVIVAAIFTLIPLGMKVDRLHFVAFSISPVFLAWLLLPPGFKYFAILVMLGIGLSGAILLGLYFHGRRRLSK